MNKPRVLVIMGSTRDGRICQKVAEWVADIGRETGGADFEIVDLRDWPLPMDDEPAIPAMGGYVNDHTLAWSRKVSEGDAIVFVSPQYNWGYPAPLKNALDHLYAEWRDKPAMIVTYGSRGGDKCAAQLLQIVEALHMRPVPTMSGHDLGQVRQAFAELMVQLQPAT
jgi:NAD(P)H-dependent FMN reductase